MIRNCVTMKSDNINKMQILKIVYEDINIKKLFDFKDDEAGLELYSRNRRYY